MTYDSECYYIVEHMELSHLLHVVGSKLIASFTTEVKTSVLTT